MTFSKADSHIQTDDSDGWPKPEVVINNAVTQTNFWFVRQIFNHYPTLARARAIL